MESKEQYLLNLIKRLPHLVKEKRIRNNPGELNREWTKIALIIPILEVLGWDKGVDISHEVSLHDSEKCIDLILKCQSPIGIETKNLDESPPGNIEHQQIKKALEQCKVKECSYFIWTNGDCWQFISLALPNAPLYQIVLNKEGDGAISIADKLHIINKDVITNYPESLNNAIHEHWKMTAFPKAWKWLLKEHPNDLIQFFREGLPGDLKIQDEIILEFMQTLNSDDFQFSTKPLEPSTSNDWQKLIDSYEPYYYQARRRFRSGYYLKLGSFLISEKYRPLSMASTEISELRNVVNMFEEWGFMEGSGNEKYHRVEESIPYLKKLLMS